MTVRYIIHKIVQHFPPFLSIQGFSGSSKSSSSKSATGEVGVGDNVGLNVIALQVPALRERRDDIPLLAHHFLEKYAARNRKSAKGFSPLAMDMLIKHDWPGNVRELENIVERAVILMTGEHVTEKQLPANIAGADTGAGRSVFTGLSLAEGSRSLEEIEKEVILATLEATEGNKSETARRLGITRKTLHNKLKSYGEG